MDPDGRDGDETAASVVIEVGPGSDILVGPGWDVGPQMWVQTPGLFGIIKVFCTFLIAKTVFRRKLKRNSIRNLLLVVKQEQTTKSQSKTKSMHVAIIEATGKMAAVMINW